MKTIFILIIPLGLFSCNNPTTATLKNNPAKADTTVSIDVSKKPNQKDSMETKYTKEVWAGGKYAFADDTICQNIEFSKVSLENKLKIPEQLKFKLTLHDKQGKIEDKVFKGIAKLSSPEETFSDDLANNGDTYFAADYNLTTDEYNLKIRLDVDSYKACVILIKPNNQSDILEGYIKHLGEFPNEGVMKIGECK